MTDLLETAVLARIALNEREQQAIFPAFEQMLSLLGIMQALDNDPSMPAVTKQADFVLASAKPVNSGFFRPDTAQPEVQKDLIESMLSQAPERDGNFIVIPNVL